MPAGSVQARSIGSDLMKIDILMYAQEAKSRLNSCKIVIRHETLSATTLIELLT